MQLVYLVRHGETEWSRSGQHTGLTDLPLTERGLANAARLGERLRALNPSAVFTSPLQRAFKTCEIAGFGPRAEIDPDLVEWDYGEYEGRTTAEIRVQRPGWQLFRDGCPSGETPEQIGARADRVAVRLRHSGPVVLVFSSRHFLQVLAARWLGLDAAGGRFFTLATASVSILSTDHGPDDPVIRLWNDDHHLEQ